MYFIASSFSELVAHRTNGERRNRQLREKSGGPDRGESNLCDAKPTSSIEFDPERLGRLGGQVRLILRRQVSAREGARRRPLEHFPVWPESGAVTGAVPASLGIVPGHDASKVRAACGDSPLAAVLVPAQSYLPSVLGDDAPFTGGEVRSFRCGPPRNPV